MTGASKQADGTRRTRRLRAAVKRLVPLGLVLLVAGGVVAVAVWPREQEAPSKTVPKVVNVHTERVVARATLDDWYELEGTVQPEAVRQICAEVPGRIEAYGPAGAGSAGRALDEGDTVEAGQLLVRLNEDLLHAQWAQAKAQHAYNQQDYERMRELRATGAATQRELDLARTRQDVSAAALKEARVRLDRATIEAPVGGVLNRLPLKVGEYVAPGDAVAEIVNRGRMTIVLAVPEPDVPYLRVGQEVRIRDADIEPEQSAAGQRPGRTGRIRYISAVADPATLTTRVEVEVDNAPDPDTGARPFYSGQIVTARLTRRTLRDVLLVPLDAVKPQETGGLVYVVEGDTAQPRAVRVDLRATRTINGRDYARVFAPPGGQGPLPLHGGELLIVKGHWSCGPGQRVRITAGPKPGDAAASDGPERAPAAEDAEDGDASDGGADSAAEPSSAPAGGQEDAG